MTKHSRYRIQSLRGGLIRSYGGWNDFEIQGPLAKHLEKRDAGAIKAAANSAPPGYLQCLGEWDHFGPRIQPADQPVAEAPTDAPSAAPLALPDDPPAALRGYAGSTFAAGGRFTARPAQAQEALKATPHPR